MTHKIKLAERYADAVATGKKPFEVRYNDRDYQKGDLIQFVTYDAEEKAFYKHPISDMVFVILYVYSGVGVEPGYVVLGIEHWIEPDEEA